MGFFTVTPKSALHDTTASNVDLEQSIIVVHEHAIRPQLMYKYTAALAGVHTPQYARDVRDTSLDLEHSSLLWTTVIRGKAAAMRREGMDALALHVHDTFTAHPSLGALRHAAADNTATTNGSVTTNDSATTTDSAKKSALIMAVSLRDLAHLRDSLQLSIDNATYNGAALDFATKYVDTLNDVLRASEPNDMALYFCIASAM